MSDSLLFEEAWLLLKDFSFLRSLPEEYYDALGRRMRKDKRAILSNSLEHVDRRPHEHFTERFNQRYHAGQALPKELQEKGLGSFTLTDVLNYMANDVLHEHPELLEAMKTEKPASDSRLPDRTPSMFFDAMVTDNPKGQDTRLSPHFDIGPDGRVRLKTVGHGLLSEQDRQTIEVNPYSKRDNSYIDENLPNKFNFAMKDPVNLPEDTENLIDESSLTPPPPLPTEYERRLAAINNLPISHQAGQLAALNREYGIETGEPMDLSWRLLKMTYGG